MGSHKMNTGLVLLTGVVLGYAASLFLSSEKKEQHKQALLSVKEQLPTGVVDELTTNLFGQSTQEMQRRLDEVLGDFQKRFEDLRGSVDSIDTRKYQKLVNDFAKEMQKNYDFSTAQVKQLKEFLKSDYKAVAQPESKA